MNKFTLVRDRSRLKALCALALLLGTAGCAATPNPTAQAIASANAAGTICAAAGIAVAADGSIVQTADCSDAAISNMSDVVSSGYTRY
jgi:hypothetical protein